MEVKDDRASSSAPTTSTSTALALRDLTTTESDKAGNKDKSKGEGWRSWKKWKKMERQKELKETYTASSSPSFDLPRSLHDKLLRWARAADGEVSGLGVLRVNSSNNRIELVRVDILKQDCTSGSTELDETSVAKYLLERDADHQSVRFWWHSHGNMGVFWSSTDESMMRKLADVWGVALVINKAGDQRLSLVINKPISCFIDLPVRVFEDWDGTEDMKQAHSDVKRLVNDRFHSSFHGGYPGFHGYSDFHEYSGYMEHGSPSEGLATTTGATSSKDGKSTVVDARSDLAKKRGRLSDLEAKETMGQLSAVDWMELRKLRQEIEDLEVEEALDDDLDGDEDVFPGIPTKGKDEKTDEKTVEMTFYHDRAVVLIARYMNKTLTPDEQAEFRAYVKRGQIIFPSEDEKGDGKAKDGTP